jgi:hypothetical protein
VTAVALDVSQVKVADSPAVIVVGMAVKRSMLTVRGGDEVTCRNSCGEYPSTPVS